MYLNRSFICNTVFDYRWRFDARHYKYAQRLKPVHRPYLKFRHRRTEHPKFGTAVSLLQLDVNVRFPNFSKHVIISTPSIFRDTFRSCRYMKTRMLPAWSFLVSAVRDITKVDHGKSPPLAGRSVVPAQLSKLRLSLKKSLFKKKKMEMEEKKKRKEKKKYDDLNGRF